MNKYQNWSCIDSLVDWVGKKIWQLNDVSVVELKFYYLLKIISVFDYILYEDNPEIVMCFSTTSHYRNDSVAQNIYINKR